MHIIYWRSTQLKPGWTLFVVWILHQASPQCVTVDSVRSAACPQVKPFRNICSDEPRWSHYLCENENREHQRVTSSVSNRIQTLKTFPPVFHMWKDKTGLSMLRNGLPHDQKETEKLNFPQKVELHQPECTVIDNWINKCWMYWWAELGSGLSGCNCIWSALPRFTVFDPTSLLGVCGGGKRKTRTSSLQFPHVKPELQVKNCTHLQVSLSFRSSLSI